MPIRSKLFNVLSKEKQITDPMQEKMDFIMTVTFFTKDYAVKIYKYKHVY